MRKKGYGFYCIVKGIEIVKNKKKKRYAIDKKKEKKPTEKQQHIIYTFTQEILRGWGGEC